MAFLVAVVAFISMSVGTENPRRTMWVSPWGEKPGTYEEWKKEWHSRPFLYGGKIIYKTASFAGNLADVHADSFVFGEDYAYYKGIVTYSDGSLCTDVPPKAGFIVFLNRDSSKILTDLSPRWGFGDPNISGKGWFGIELGNFSDPEISVGDSFTIVFTTYGRGIGEQGFVTDNITALPFSGFPKYLVLNEIGVPFPPTGLVIRRDGNVIKLRWDYVEDCDYFVYKRSLNDTLAINFPRMQYSLVGRGIRDSVFVDTSCVEGERYAYVIFSRDIDTGKLSGHSIEVSEEVESVPVRAIIVQPELYSGIESSLFQLVEDWENEGASVLVYNMQFSDHVALRDTLRNINGLTGVLLIGDFPVPWYQVWEDDGKYQEYPVDLYYMDLDGIWEDRYKKDPSGEGYIPGSDGIYDTHRQEFPRNDEAPEIIVGRITPTEGMGDPIEVVNKYLDKCHRYRVGIGGIRRPFRGLAYPDDDWSEWGYFVATSYMRSVYSDFDVVYDINQTSATDYRDRLSGGYSLIHVYVHSWSRGHAFKINDGEDNEYFFNTDILPAGADANFYLLFACSNCRYTEDLNCGSVYALLTDYGINTIGTTHSGGLTEYNVFYSELAKGISFGESLLRTLQKVGEGGFSKSAKSWYYGITLNGDPFVVPLPPTHLDISGNLVRINSDVDIQVYPNPFNDMANVRYVLPTSGKISIKLYDINGRLVKVLFEGGNREGEHIFKFNMGSFPSGVYFLSLNFCYETVVKKIMYIKIIIKERLICKL